MSSIFSCLTSSASTLAAFQQALTVVQNNVSNVDTPGYAALNQTFEALPFDPATGETGGVTAGEVTSARDEYAEDAVRQQQSLYGRSNEMATDFGQIEPLFSVTGDAGIPGAINQFFSAVSAWSTNPNDATSRQTVLDQAGTMADSFNQAADGLNQASGAIQQQIGATVDQINQLAGQIASLNQLQQQTSGGTNSSAADTQLHATLEQLSSLANITVLPQQDGSYTVLLGGQIPLVVGSQQFQIQMDTSDASEVRIDSPQSGITQDPTSLIQGGSLSGLLTMRNQTIPSLMGNLNSLAQATADQVNGILAQGVDSTGAPGAPLFQYNAPDASDAAATLSVTAITGSQLAGALPSAPGGNDNIIDLAALANQPIADLGNSSLTDYYAQTATQLGQQSSQATADQQSQQQTLVQAQTLRSNVSGVSLDEEAANLIQFQTAYQAVSEMVTVLNEVSQSTIDMMQGTT
jgi:flagellar hook-associated protein 1 FlgK